MSPMGSDDGAPATKGDLKRLETATKQDIAQLGAATKQDIERLETATKQDIEQLGAATRKDFKRLEVDMKQLETAMKRDIEQLGTATKQDIQQLEASTKADISRHEVSTKEDLKRLDDKIDRIAVEVIRLHGGIFEIKETMGGLATKTDISRIFEYADEMIRKGEVYNQKAHTHGKMLIDLEDKIRNHERRITRLETDPASAQPPL
ncbi:MAG: hypothetical protein HY551_00610 [Elusimicrobia bacterium]|nr:hypothetical protein [Elusimicrobiota bacterium]